MGRCWQSFSMWFTEPAGMWFDCTSLRRSRFAPRVPTKLNKIYVRSSIANSFHNLDNT